MALVKGINSYVEAVEADTYFEDRLDAAAWAEASQEQKEQALVTSTAVLDRMEWTGTVISEEQPLAWPRIGSYFDPRLGTEVILDDTVPKRIIDGTYEEAYHLLNNDGLLDDTGSVLNLQVSTIVLEEITDVSDKSSVVDSIVKPLLAKYNPYGGGSGNAWWRAN